MSGKTERQGRQLKRIEQSLAAAIKATQPSPWYQTNLFWGPLGVGAGLVLTVIAPSLPTVRLWLLIIAWVLFSVSFWVMLREMKRRGAALVLTVLSSSLVGGGLVLLQALATDTAQKSAPSPIKQQSLFSSVPAYVVSTGGGACSLFMSLVSLAGDNTKSNPLIVTPIVYLLWVRLFNQTDYKMLVDNYLVELSDSESGPWVDTVSLPLQSSAYYCNSSWGNSSSLHAPIESIRGNTNGIKLIIDGRYTEATSSDLSCLQECTLLDIPALGSDLANGIGPHATATGWLAVNPPAAERPTSAHRHTFYRITADTVAGEVVSSGSLSRKPGTIVYVGDAYLKLQNFGETDLGRFPLAYAGPPERKK